MIMRPVDFISNAGPYVIGFLTYLVMLPVFGIVFQVYAMSNLHDVSWGNRPTTGEEAFSANKNDQKKS